MTNTYNICGKGTCEEPPACLKATICKACLSEQADRMCKKFMPGAKFASKHKSKNKK